MRLAPLILLPAFVFRLWTRPIAISVSWTMLAIAAVAVAATGWSTVGTFAARLSVALGTLLILLWFRLDGCSACTAEEKAPQLHEDPDLLHRCGSRGRALFRYDARRRWQSLECPTK